ncbi:MAG: ABC transporter permease subunit, partial [Pseudomonadota bacterium]
MEDVIAYVPLLAEGTGVTVMLAVLSLALATALGALGAAGRLSGWRAADWSAQGYTTLVRGVPDLVMILLIYFGGQRALNGAVELVGLERIEVSRFAAGVLAIGFIYGGYLAETFRGAFAAIPRGQGEAGLALGLTRLEVLWSVGLPPHGRLALPGYAHGWVVVVESTPV